MVDLWVQEVQARVSQGHAVGDRWVAERRDFDESDEYCPNCDNHFVIDAETPKSRALNEGKAQVLVGVEGDTAKEAEELREKMMRKMMEEGIDEDLLEDWGVCGKEKSSEAGNRTPVVRVTGGNTKPLYYFGPVEVLNEGYMKRKEGRERKRIRKK